MEDLIKKDIISLQQLGYKVLPINKKYDNLIIFILWCMKQPDCLLHKIPEDIVLNYILPNFITNFNIDIHYNNFKILIPSQYQKFNWIIFFDMNPYLKKKNNICFYKIASTNNYYININSIKNRIENKYMTIYSNFVKRLSIPFILKNIQKIINSYECKKLYKFCNKL